MPIRYVFLFFTFEKSALITLSRISLMSSFGNVVTASRDFSSNSYPSAQRPFPTDHTIFAFFALKYVSMYFSYA